MKVYQVGLGSLPKICFAHEYQTDHYAMHFHQRQGFIEISYLLEGDIYYTKEGVTERIPAGALMVDCREVDATARAEGRQAHITVGFKIEPAEGELLLPFFTVFPDGEWYVEKIRAIIREYARRQTTTPRLAAMVLDLLCAIDEGYRRQLSSTDSSYAEQRYAAKAERYILDHLTERIYVAEIAAAVGLSVGYLSNLFRRCTGQTLVEYINRVKLHRIRELVERGEPVHRAAAAFGMEDAGYVSRLYRKYFGGTLTNR